MLNILWLKDERFDEGNDYADGNDDDDVDDNGTFFNI